MTSAHANYFTSEEVVLAASLELSNKSWKLGLQDGQREKPSLHTVSDESLAARLLHVVAIIEESRKHWGLAASAPVVLSYEAGQDGFWIYRALSKLGYTALVVDPASIPVERQARRAKTDRLDVIRLVSSLRGWLRGERDRMRVVNPPSADEEAMRQLVRERGVLQAEIGAHKDRMRKLLRTQGCCEAIDGQFEQRLTRGAIRGPDGQPLPVQLQCRLLRECGRLALAEAQFDVLQKTLVPSLPAPVRERIDHLKRLKGVGEVGAMRLGLELFWRRFQNRRQVGACLGLVPQPYDSGQMRVDQGISKQGNRRVRALLIEMAWLWLRYQPDSAIAKWFAQRTSGSGPNKRAKRIAIVAVARKLAIALWRYLTDGVMPEGAQLKTK